jgi:lysyl-tRNA synthetase, class II
MSKDQRPEHALIDVRKEKAARLRSRGQNPFANDVAALTPLGDVREAAAYARGADGKYPQDQVEARPYAVAGRVLFVRAMGGATFVRLRDRSGELQLYCDKESMGSAYDALEDIDLGDIVEAKGTTMATQRGELSILAKELRLLTKAYRPLPTKTSFKDVEQRYRQRYVDLVANGDVRTTFLARTQIISALRAFLDERGFVEVETPTMHSIVGGAIARPFSTHHNALDLDLFLRIAPELFLKRLVVGGFERVYEIARCYRNEGISTRHNPEFSMLEFYMAYASYETLMDLTEELLRAVDARLAARLPEAHAAWLAARPFTFARFERIPMKDAILRAITKAGLPSSIEDAIASEAPPIKEWAAAAKAKGRAIDWGAYRAGALKCASHGERVFAAYEYLAEPFLAVDYREGDKNVPVFVTDYPFEVSPLARKKDRDPTLVDRFELFVNGQELCNAFSELNDPEDQAERFAAQQDAKKRGAEETMDFDHDYIRALEHGMPPSAGFGMGVDRLTMMLTGSASIRDVILFPLLRPEQDQ